MFIYFVGRSGESRIRPCLAPLADKSFFSISCVIRKNWPNIAPGGGSRISPRRGHELSRGGTNIRFCQFSQKLHEIERIWTPTGGACPKFYYVDPPLAPVQDRHPNPSKRSPESDTRKVWLRRRKKLPDSRCATGFILKIKKPNVPWDSYSLGDTRGRQ